MMENIISNILVNICTVYYTLEDFELFAQKIGIKHSRLEKIFELILSSTPKVMEMIEHSFLSHEGKASYIRNYEERLKLHLCYSIEHYKFDGKMQKVISRFTL